MAGVLDEKVLGDLRESVGGDHAFFSELIDEFLDDAPGQLDTLREAVSAGDDVTARRAAHTLKSNGRTFGASEFASLCAKAEAAAAAGDLDDVRSELDAIDTAWGQVHAALLAARDGGA
jgi:HPt (histidine-containing phosphotransfer) domain-containing protein